MKKYTWNWNLDVYKPGKAEGLWRYSVSRINNWTNEYLMPDGTWSLPSFERISLRSKEEMIAFTTRHCGPQITIIE